MSSNFRIENIKNIKGSMQTVVNIEVESIRTRYDME